MAHAVQAALEQRLAEIMEQLRSFVALSEEREHIQKLLALYERQGPSNGAGRPFGGGHFAVNPSSKSSRVLAAAREMLKASPDHRLTFLAIFHGLPRELVGAGRNAREHVRGILQKGERAGIEYVTANEVRLVGEL